MVRENRYVLANQSGDYMTIETSDSDAAWAVIYVQKIPERDLAPGSSSKGKSPYMRPRQIARADTLSDAVHAADTFALQKFPWNFVHNGQAWRRAPATEGQLAFLNKFRPMSEQLTAEMISKGKATDMISKVKFGAKGWFSKLEADKKRDDRAVEQVRQVEGLRRREQVKVGPVSR